MTKKKVIIKILENRKKTSRETKKMMQLSSTKARHAFLSSERKKFNWERKRQGT